MSVSWLTSPLHAYFYWKEYKAGTADWVVRFNDNARWSKKERIKGVVSAFVVCPVVIIFMAFFAAGHDFNLLPINSSRTALGLAGWVMSGGGVLYMATFELILIKRVLCFYKN